MEPQPLPKPGDIIRFEETTWHNQYSNDPGTRVPRKSYNFGVVIRLYKDKLGNETSGQVNYIKTNGEILQRSVRMYFEDSDIYKKRNCEVIGHRSELEGHSLLELFPEYFL